MYKKLACILLLTTSLQAMPPKIAQKVEEMHGESDNESQNNGSGTKSQESAATSCESHPPYVLPNFDLIEEQILNNTKKFEEAIKASNKEKEELLAKYVRAAELLGEKQKELEELGKEGQEEIDRLAEQRDEYKKELEVQKSLSQLIFNLIGKSAKEIEEVAVYARKMGIRGEEK